MFSDDYFFLISNSMDLRQEKVWKTIMTKCVVKYKNINSLLLLFIKKCIKHLQNV